MRVIEYVGTIMFMIGACGMDSENQFIPAGLAIAGLLILQLAFRFDKG